MDVMLTRDALTQGFWAVTQEYFREWEKYCVVETETKSILLSATTKENALKYIEFINGNGGVPEFFKTKVNRVLYRRF